MFWISKERNGGPEKEKREQAPALHVVIYRIKYIRNYRKVKEKLLLLRYQNPR